MEFHSWQLLFLHSALNWLHTSLAQVVKFNEQGRNYDFTDKKLQKEYEEELRQYNQLFGGYGNVSGFVHIDAGDIEYDLDSMRIKRECYTCYYSTWTPLLTHSHGTINCEEPFVEDGIPLTSCEGSCGMARGQLRPGVNITVRGCFEECVEYDGPRCKVRCCRGSRCNHFWTSNDTSGTSGSNGVILISGVVLCCIRAWLGL